MRQREIAALARAVADELDFILGKPDWKRIAGAEKPRWQCYSPIDNCSMSVYAMKAGPYVKIGRSRDPLSRMSDVQVGNPREVKIVATWCSLHLTEADAHEEVKRHRVRGEWFRWNKAVVNFIAFSRCRLWPERF